MENKQTCLSCIFYPKYCMGISFVHNDCATRSCGCWEPKISNLKKLGLLIGKVMSIFSKYKINK